jgi:hypothetical protein
LAQEVLVVHQVLVQTVLIPCFLVLPPQVVVVVEILPQAPRVALEVQEVAGLGQEGLVRVVQELLVKGILVE